MFISVEGFLIYTHLYRIFLNFIHPEDSLLCLRKTSTPPTEAPEALGRGRWSGSWSGSSGSVFGVLGRPWACYRATCLQDTPEPPAAMITSLMDAMAASHPAIGRRPTICLELLSMSSFSMEERHRSVLLVFPDNDDSVPH